MKRLVRSKRLSLRHCVALVVLLFLYTGSATAQDSNPPPADKTSTASIFRDVLKHIRDAKSSAAAARKRQADLMAANKPDEAKAAEDEAKQAEFDAQGAASQDFTVYLQYMGYRTTLSELEEQRIDKQVGAGANSSGTTSAASKGTVPSLFNFAVENGALTRSQSGTTITFGGSPANIIKALAKGGYISGAPSFDPGTLSSILSNFTFTISFDASRGNNAGTFTGDRQQLSGYTVRYQILNHRDPRHPKYARRWYEVVKGPGAVLATRLNQLGNRLVTEKDTKDLFKDWQNETNQRVATASDDQLVQVLQQQADKFKEIIDKSPDLSGLVSGAGRALVDYMAIRDQEIKKITKSATLAVEVNEIRQANTNGAVTSASPGPLPNLTNINVVFSKGLVDGPEITANGSVTLFDSLPAALTIGHVRDFQFSGQADVPLPEIRKIGRSVLSFSGEFVSLREEPLGNQVIINTVPVSAKGNIGLGQVKLTIPVKGSGVRMPISVTWSNRTELIKESEVRANIGLTFDLDQLFAKP